MSRLLKSLYPYIKPNMNKAIIAIILSAALAGIKFAQAYFVKPIFDKGLSPSGTFDEVLFLAGLLVLLALANVPCRFFHYYLMRFVVDDACCKLRTQVYQKIQNLPLSYFQKNKQGELLSKVTQDTQLLTIGFHGTVDFIREPLIGLSMLGLAVYRDWQLALIVLVVSPLFIVIFRKSGKKVKQHQSQVQKYIAGITHNVGEGISSQKITKAFNLERFVMERFNKAQDLFFRYQLKSTKVEELTSPLIEFVGALAFASVIVFAHKRVVSGAMTTGDFVSFVTALALLMDPIRKFSRANLKLNQARAASERVFEIVDLESEVSEGNDIKRFESKIEFVNVTFSYGDQEVLKNFNLIIEKGQKVALVGLSGAGKSTIIGLLLKLYPVTSGQILIDGRNINNISLRSLRNLFALVSQDVFLFNDSVLENLLLGNNKSPAEVDEALTVSNSKSFVDQLPEGVNTVIGDRGTRLSGGQSQRITIARAYLSQAPIYLFDEATSALDNESEKLVQAALDKVSVDKTVVTVAHRLSTVKDYDKVVVLAHGRLQEQGNHQELMSKKGEYFRLYELGQSV